MIKKGTVGCYFAHGSFYATKTEVIFLNKTSPTAFFELLA